MSALPAAGLIMIVAGLGAYYATGELSLFSVVNLVLGPLLLIVSAIVRGRSIRGFAGARSRRIVWRWTAILAAVSVGVVALVAKTRNWDARIDLTVARSYTLSPQTLDICAQVDDSLDAPRIDLYFFEDSLLARDVRLLVSAYESACKHVTVTRVDYEAAPREAASVFANFNTSVVSCRDANCDPVGYPSESNITASILRLTSQRGVNVFFMVGHGEVDLASESENGFAGLAAALRDEGLTPRAMVGPAQSEIGDDVDLLIIAAPERDFLPPELDALDAYLRRGGRLLALLEPGVESNFHGLLERWGFGLPAGVVADSATTPLVRDPKPVALLVHLFAPYHPVTRQMSNRTMVLVPGARAVRRTRKPEPDDRLDDLAFSSARAWLESDVAGALAGRAIEPGPGEPAGQEISIAAAGRYPRGDAEARIVVIGDRDFASNRLLGSLYARDLLLNAIWWLAEDDSRIAIRPKAWTPDQDPLTLQQTVAYFYFMAFALPELLLLMGLGAWYRQRT